MTDWIDIYRPLLGQRIAGIVWMPLSSDTPQLASEIHQAVFSFSGSSHIRFENEASLRLSWRTSGDRYVLATGDAAVWAPHALDRLQAQGGLWDRLTGATLIAAEFFTLPDDTDRQVVAVKHKTSGGSFWIGTGGSDFIGDYDDLWVGIDCDPPNRTDLISTGTIS